MPALQPQSRIISLEQYEALPEDIRAEVFEGQIYYMASPSQIHQSILLELSTLLNFYVKSRKVNIYDDLYINFLDIAGLLNI